MALLNSNGQEFIGETCTDPTRSKNYCDVDVLFPYAVLIRLHKVEVFKHSNCYDFCIPPCTELMEKSVLVSAGIELIFFLVADVLDLL